MARAGRASHLHGPELPKLLPKVHSRLHLLQPSAAAFTLTGVLSRYFSTPAIADNVVGFVRGEGCSVGGRQGTGGAIVALARANGVQLIETHTYLKIGLLESA
jgi:hypothetical protein|eukprot:CAMPEP_0174315530 /NCGR_PEP_ID=MMETSP0810-20121108/6345_1 /TAXON_ID=73025 ORGANISM="Eutreptiella gymnastica-like, Strain CCMP1594" /NCGR_SAMPLE_ID=MMETSP0810 /ASSEMBLY_ACC=CAM_ASM_000659 /LENGTH=102 /DNA_ID=CAMNT_0015424941 /DNA_START=112 /DNA_END=420 /DNA_ORIENTATION=-